MKTLPYRCATHSREKGTERVIPHEHDAWTHRAQSAVLHKTGTTHLRSPEHGLKLAPRSFGMVSTKLELGQLIALCRQRLSDCTEGGAAPVARVLGADHTNALGQQPLHRAELLGVLPTEQDRSCRRRLQTNSRSCTGSGCGVAWCQPHEPRQSRGGRPGPPRLAAASYRRMTDQLFSSIARKQNWKGLGLTPKIFACLARKCPCLRTGRRTGAPAAVRRRRASPAAVRRIRGRYTR
eukprot:SAG11_NODE_1370_length_5096_cov_2.366620_5_plen_237_part_00